MTSFKILSAAVALAAAVTLSGCAREADVASRNISEAADQFKASRRIVFYNGITGEYLLEIRGLCSLDAEPRKVAITCKTDQGAFKKHFLGLSDNVTYFAEQTDAAAVGTSQYHVTFRPTTLVPSVSFSK